MLADKGFGLQHASFEGAGRFSPRKARRERRRAISRLAVLVAAGTAVLAWAGDALAADSRGNFSVRGVGAVPCSQVVSRVEARGPEVAAFVAWADGALTVTNRAERDVFDMVPFINPPGVVTIVAVNICRNNPQTPYATAVLQAIEVMRPLRVRASGQPVTIRVGDASVALRRETVILVQSRLRELRLLTGAADGEWGPASQEAMRRFQESRQLPQTRIPDIDSVLRLVLTR